MLDSKILQRFCVLMFLLTSSSCAFVNPPAGPGLIYTETSDITYYDPYIVPNKKAVLCSKNILGLFSYGDNGYDKFRAISGIRKIASIEKTYSSRFFVYGKSCVIIKGE